MTAQGCYKVTEMFEEALASYTGAPYAVALDSCSSGLFLALTWEKKRIGGKFVGIPKQTFPSVPCAAIHAGLTPRFKDEAAAGAYRLFPFSVYDSALRFTRNMYIKGSHMCISFTGPKKRLKLVKGGAILTDSKDAYEWFKQARMSGRHEQSFMTDIIEFPGWNFYMMPEIAARGLMLMREFYDDNGEARYMEDVICEYPDLSQMPAFAIKH